jgi:predicted nucleotidyltransferase
MKADQFGLRQSDLQNIIKILEQFNNISEAILFGSRAKGNYRHGSDFYIS